MKTKQQVFMYSRKEIFVLLLLIFLGILFALTLGIHLGKRVSHQSDYFLSQVSPVLPIESMPELLQETEDLPEEKKDLTMRIDQHLTNSLHQETLLSQIHTRVPKEVDLPTQTKSELQKKPEAKELLIHPKYTLQLGSYPSLEDTKGHLAQLERLQMKTFVQVVDLKEKGKWYRICLGQFTTRHAAEKTAAKYVSQNQITSYVVARLQDGEMSP